MNVFVQVWCEIDPTLNVRIDRQTNQPLTEPADQLRRVSPVARAGMAAAVQLRPTAVIAFAIGSGHAEALRHALAAGAARAVELTADAADAEAIAPRAIADWLAGQQADLLVGDRLAGAVAARLGWAHLAGLEELRSEAGRLQALRALGRGDRERVSARLPAAVRLQADAWPPYISKARLQAVADRPIERVVLATVAGPSEMGPLQISRPRTRTGQAPAPPSGSGSDRLQALMGGGKPAASTAARVAKTAGTPEELAEEFVRYLLHHNLLPLDKR